VFLSQTLVEASVNNEPETANIQDFMATSFDSKEIPPGLNPLTGS
jgi:hypothetical protein